LHDIAVVAWQFVWSNIEKCGVSLPERLRDFKQLARLGMIKTVLFLIAERLNSMP
jgi:hypothetical protein